MRFDRADFAEIQINKFPVPVVGKYIIFNEVYDVYTHSGHAYCNERGIAQVNEICGNQILLTIFKTPWYSCRECVSVIEFRAGLYRFRYLKNYVYMSTYNYEELNLEHLAPTLQILLEE